MKIYEKIRRKQLNTGVSIENVFKNQKECRQIENKILTLSQQWYVFAVTELSVESFEEFRDKLYLPIIWNKPNANINALLNNITPETIQEQQRFFCAIRKQELLVGGAIFTYDNDMFIFSYKAADETKVEGYIGLWTILDFLFFKEAIKKNPRYFSYGKDRNYYGWLWASPSLAKHKLLLRFSPVVPEEAREIEIDEDNLSPNSLIFTEPDEKGIFTTALVVQNQGGIDETLLIKRGFNVVHK